MIFLVYSVGKIMRLSKEAHSRAKRFIFEAGRPLEQARYLYHFEDGSKAAVIAELAKFQNEDGGFGHALEPDMRMAPSSMLATTVGLQILGQIGATGEDAIVQELMGYVMATYEPETKVWPIVPRHNNDFSHAPWWHDAGKTRENFGGFLANPRAEVVGYLFAYTEQTPAGLAEEMAEAIIGHMDSYGEKVGMHDLACYVATAEETAVPQPIRDRLIPKLNHSLLASVETDPSKWGGYTPKPLAYIHSPESPFAELMPEAIAANLDDVIGRQGEDGAWRPPWSWAEQDPEGWALAEQDWAGVITLNTLRQLHAFGRFE